MNGYNFTERVRKVLQFAREESARLRHEFVGPEHIMLALIREGEGLGIVALRNLMKDPEAIRDQLERQYPPGRTSHGIGPDLPYTSRAKKVLELAMTEARELNHSYVGTEHLMLGLVREGKSLVAQILVADGATLEAVRSEIVRLWDANPGMKRPPSLTARLSGTPATDPVPKPGTILQKAGIFAVVLLMITTIITLWIPWGNGAGMWIPKVLLTILVAGLAGVAVAVMREATRC